MIFDRWGKQDIVLSSTLYLNYEFRSMGKRDMVLSFTLYLEITKIRLKMGGVLASRTFDHFYIK